MMSKRGPDKFCLYELYRGRLLAVLDSERFARQYEREKASEVPDDAGILVARTNGASLDGTSEARRIPQTIGSADDLPDGWSIVSTTCENCSRRLDNDGTCRGGCDSRSAKDEDPGQTRTIVAWLRGVLAESGIRSKVLRDGSIETMNTRDMSPESCASAIRKLAAGVLAAARGEELS